jgi:hypothetical protein
VGRDGQALAHFQSMVAPDSRQMISALEKALAQR